MGRGQGREASELLFGRPLRGSGPKTLDHYSKVKSWPERYDEIEDFDAGPDPYDWLDHGTLIYVPDPFITNQGAVVYDAIYLSPTGFIIALGSDNQDPGLVEIHPTLVEACQRMTELRHEDVEGEFIPPDKIDVNADEVLALMEKNAVFKS